MRNFIVFIVMIIISGLLLADTGGPDGFGYMWADQEEPEVTFEWIEPDTSLAGEASFATTDDAATSVPIPFPITYYGTTYSDTIIVTTNGVAGFDMTEIEEYINDSIPTITTPNCALYIFWDDLMAYDSSVVYYHTTGSSPDQIFNITWYHWFRRGYSSDPEDPIYFQLQFFEAEDDNPNTFQFQYLDPNLSSISYSGGASATVGIEDPSGMDGLLYSYNTASLDSGSAIKFWCAATSNHDCGVVSIIEPEENIVAGSSADVVALLRNFSSEDEDVVPTFLNIFDESGDTVFNVAETTAIAAWAFDTLTFSGWLPTEGGDYIVECYVDVEDDTIGDNDAIADTVTVWEHISRGGPDIAGYMWFDSYDESGPLYVAPPVSEGTAITELEGDDEFATIDLPFTFTYYEEDFTSIGISSNGWISFDSTVSSSYFSNDSIPDSDTPNALLAVYWDDSDCDVTADPDAAIMQYYDTGTSSFWIIWNRIQLPYSSTTSPITYGARLFMNGTIEYHYLDAHADDDPYHDYGLSATVGIENLDGTDGLIYEFNGWPPGNPLFDHFAIRFVPPWIGPDTIGPVISHDPPDSIFADVPGFCIELETQIRDFNGIEEAAIHVHYPTPGTRPADTIDGEIYTFRICGLQPGDSVSYHFEASDTLDNAAVSPNYNIHVRNPHQGGPDITEYYFVDSWAEWDSMSPAHNWVELNPDSGGVGTEIALGFGGLSEPIGFSFFVPFYGIISGGVIISEDGWALMDTSLSGVPVATPPPVFPNPDPPNAIIAPLWTDLEPEYSGLTGGGVYYYDFLDDSPGVSCFIIQWDMYETGTTSPDLMRFQAKVYYDEEIFGSRIEYVYRNIEDYALDETGICIEHETGYDGLSYVYLDNPEDAPVPVSGSSVLFYNPELHGIGEAKLPEKFAITAYPNPFNASVAIDIASPAPDANLDIFDINGKKVKSFNVIGSERIIWRGEDSSGQPLASGLYFARLKSGEREITTKLMLLK